MDRVSSKVTTAQNSFRLWPGVVIVALQWLLRFAIPRVMPDAILVGVFAGILGGLGVLVWWAFFSRGPGIERWGGIILLIAAPVVVSRIVDRSIATGMMGMMFPIFLIPVLSLAFVLWAVLSQRLSTGLRRASMVAAIALASGGWALLRTDGLHGEAGADFAWRWSKTPEERLVMQGPLAAGPPVTKVVAESVETKVEAAAVRAVAPVAEAAPPAGSSWPGFRGPGRDSVITGVHIKTDWSASPPVELWRRPIGPGWGSFAVRGDLLYTQEQRGVDEFVACYNATTGKPVWAHRDPARFWEANAGAGPRATPTLSGGNLYTFGATGILNALSAADGAVLWSRNAATDTGTKVPGWGFASSPLVVGDLVIIATSGQLAAYDAVTGAPRWTGPAGGEGYSSPHLVTIGGVEQVLLANSLGMLSVAGSDGKLHWKYAWPSDTRIMQPAVTSEGDLLITSGDAMGGGGMRRLAVAHGPDGSWNVEERWTSAGLKPNFNDFVVHDGYLFGFDGSILACVDLKDGKRKWKGGRYGFGQLVLLGDQGVLLVLSEEGELALVRAGTDKFTELARLPAIEGKTWNHPVLVGDRLLVRNGSEMAAFRLGLEGR